MSAGMHLSDDPVLEYGPLLSCSRVATRRLGYTDRRRRRDRPAGYPAFPRRQEFRLQAERLAAWTRSIRACRPAPSSITTSSPRWRLTSSLLFGAGKDRDGARLELGVQRLAAVSARHRCRAVGRLFAGQPPVQRGLFRRLARRSVAQPLPGTTAPAAAWGRARGRALELGAVAVLDADLEPAGDAPAGQRQNSPLVERPTNVTVSTAIAYRF
jgi:outer membrane protein